MNAQVGPPPVSTTVIGPAPPGVGPVYWLTGVTALDEADRGPGPLACCARTLKVYAVLLASPVTVQVVAGAVAVHPALAGADVTV